MMSTSSSFQSLHKDRITTVVTNHNHTRLLTASIDHRIAVYNITPLASTSPTLLDLFTAHDAEIRDVKFLRTLTGCYFVSIGADLSMRIYMEDTSQQARSGRRFRRIATIKSETFTPFVSVDAKTIGDIVHVVVIDRQGLLSLYEPTELDQYKDWSLVHQLHVVHPIPVRGESTSFKVCFDSNVLPLPYVASCGNDREQLGVFVVANDHVKVYRSSSSHDTISDALRPVKNGPLSATLRGASHRVMLFNVLTIRNSDTSISHVSDYVFLRDLAVAPMNHRGYDTVAVASSDGSIYIYIIAVTPQSVSRRTSIADALIAPQSHNLPTHPFNYFHESEVLWMTFNAHNDIWSLKWHRNGQMLLSAGADGIVKTWQQKSENSWECVLQKSRDEVDCSAG